MYILRVIMNNILKFLLPFHLVRIMLGILNSCSSKNDYPLLLPKKRHFRKKSLGLAGSDW